MDDRLREVRRTEQAEARINEDFLAWLKTSGLTWLVMVLVVLVGYFLLIRWRDSHATHQTNAWVEFEESRTSGLPSRYLSVAEQYGNVDSVGLLARLKAGQRWLEAVQAGQPLDATPGSTLALNPDDRDHYLSRADEAFRAVLAQDDGSWKRSLLMIHSLNGRAAVAEARGDVDEARRLYQQAADRAGSHFPNLAQQASDRAETVSLMARAITLPAAAEVAAQQQVREDRRPVAIDDAFRDLLAPNR